MASVATQGLYIPFPPQISILPSFTSSLIDATGEKFAYIGRVWNKDRATKSIRKVGFSFGTVTKAGGSALTVSLQDVDLTTGPVFQPDGTQDQTVAIANADAAFVSNTWYQTGAFSADRSVAFGELVAVVIEYDGAGRLGADLVNIRQLTSTGSFLRGQGGGALLTASWAAPSGASNVILEFSDGTFGTILGGYPCSAVSNSSINTGTTPDEIALEFTLPYAATIEGGWVMCIPSSNAANFDVVLYTGTTALATTSVDVNATSALSNIYEILFATPQAISASTTYRMAIKPTTATNVAYNHHDVSAAGHFDAWPGESGWGLTSRTDAGSWAAMTTTRQPFIGLRLSAIDSGGSGGGGPLVGGRLVQ